MERRIGRFELSHSPTTETPSEMIEDIVNAVNATYDEVGNSQGIKPEAVYTSDHCIPVLLALMPKLPHYELRPVKTTYLYVPHLYLTLMKPHSQIRIIADGTWQRMLSESERTAEKPKILIGTSQEVVTALRSYGLTEEQTIPWNFR